MSDIMAENLMKDEVFRLFAGEQQKKVLESLVEELKVSWDRDLAEMQSLRETKVKIDQLREVLADEQFEGVDLESIDGIRQILHTICENWRIWGHLQEKFQELEIDASAIDEICNRYRKYDELIEKEKKLDMVLADVAKLFNTSLSYDKLEWAMGELSRGFDMMEQHFSDDPELDQAKASLDEMLASFGVDCAPSSPVGGKIELLRDVVINPLVAKQVELNAAWLQSLDDYRAFYAVKQRLDAFSHIFDHVRPDDLDELEKLLTEICAKWKDWENLQEKFEGNGVSADDIDEIFNRYRQHDELKAGKEQLDKLTGMIAEKMGRNVPDQAAVVSLICDHWLDWETFKSTMENNGINGMSMEKARDIAGKYRAFDELKKKENILNCLESILKSIFYLRYNSELSIRHDDFLKRVESFISDFKQLTHFEVEFRGSPEDPNAWQNLERVKTRLDKIFMTFGVDLEEMRNAKTVYAKFMLLDTAIYRSLKTMMFSVRSDQEEIIATKTRNEQLDSENQKLNRIVHKQAEEIKSTDEISYPAFLTAAKDEELAKILSDIKNGAKNDYYEAIALKSYLGIVRAYELERGLEGIREISGVLREIAYYTYLLYTNAFALPNNEVFDIMKNMMDGLNNLLNGEYFLEMPLPGALISSETMTSKNNALKVQTVKSWTIYKGDRLVFKAEVD